MRRRGQPHEAARQIESIVSFSNKKLSAVGLFGSGFVTSYAIAEKLIERRALLFEVQRVTSPRLPRLRCLIALFSSRIQTVCN